MSKFQYDAILFDKDGTIFDSESSNKRAWMATTTAYDIDFTDDEYQQFVGMPTQDCFAIAKRMFPKHFPWDAFFESLRVKIQREYEAGVPFKQGFEAFFRHVKTLDIAIGLVTSAQRRGTELSFKHCTYLSDFDAVVTVDDVHKPKPSSEPYLLACATLGVAPEKTLVFEDSNIGLKAAIAAGCKTVAIPDFPDIDSVIKNECFAVLQNFDQAFDLL